ncbi:MAG TPA: DUF885 domain-containing protein, partial [Xanthomonadales bacterium]|nr:DUF885 domain-containing protein [Xanthomonadales bacterium]
MLKIILFTWLCLVIPGLAFAEIPAESAVLAEEVRQLINNEQGQEDSARLRRYIQISLDQAMLNNPESATQLGDPRGQDRWTDLSIEAIGQRHQEQRDALALLQSLDRSTLPAEDQVNYDLLLDTLDKQVASQVFPNELMPMNQMSGPQQFPSSVLAMMPGASVQQLENQLARMEALPLVIDQSIELMRLGLAEGLTPPRITLRDVPQQIRNQLVDDPVDSPLLTDFIDMPDSVDSLQQAALRQRAESVFSEQVVPAYERLLAFTENEYLPAARESIAARDLPNGEAWYAHNVSLRTTTQLTPEQIHAIGLQEVQRIRAEMDEVIGETGFEGSFEEFLTFLRSDPQFYHTTAEGLIREYRDIAKRADPELTKLFGVLPGTPYGVIPIPSYAEKSQTTAYYQRGSLVAGRAGYFFANTYALDTRPRWEMEALTLHEAVPGHHLQISLQQELEGVPWFRQNPSYTAFVEGWGLYAESLGTEMGFYKDPYSRFGQLTYEMWRAIRLVVDTGMHQLGWSREKAIEYFKANAGKQE